MDAALLSIFPISTACDPSGQISIAGLRLADLARQWGTPLYVYDAATIRGQAAVLRAALTQAYPAPAEITYAAKAYFSLGMARKLAGLGLGVDVVSQGELAVARKAGFAPGQIHLHGNNKSAAELTAALGLGIQSIVVDSLDELAFLEDLAARQGQPGRIWLRLTPGVTVDTHVYRQTGHHASKFGISIAGGQASQAVQAARRSPWLKLTGLHTHLGSQFSEAAAYRAGIHGLYELARQEDFCPAEFSPGGGWYVRYTPDDPLAPLSDWVEAVSEAVQAECRQSGWPLPKLILEPGRWIVGQAGVVLYTVGACKTSGDGRQWVAVDGGMADNLRPALYAARYAAALAERAHAPATQTVSVVGKFCESGDFLIPEARLPVARRGDLLAMPAAGAYHLSMASNYNLAARPAVLWLEDGQVEVLQAREDPAEAGWWV
jgi:diaminopimelate decarboxylase